MPSPSNRLPNVQEVGSFRRAVRDPGQNLKQRYILDPLQLAERFGLKLPEKPLIVMQRLGVYDEEKHGPIEPGLREWIVDVVVNGKKNSVVVGPRGGGKSQGVSLIEFIATFLWEYDSLNLGGSELQADQVYQYLVAYIDSDPYWKTLIKGKEPMRERTNLNEGNWIRVLAASSKSVRSPHAGGRRMVRGVLKDRGGLLVIDEEAEAEPEIVNAALPTVNTARPSVSIRSSTFHNAVGTFADLVDNHVEMGYTLYRWDIFDVAERCECVGECQSPEPCFREDHKETYIDEDGEQKEKLVHRAYCNGRAMYADGWIPMEEIESMWKRTKRNHASWEVEAMGSRPTTSGHVLKDQVKYAINIVPESGEELYLPGAPIEIDVDWGTVAAGLQAWQQQVTPEGVKHALLYCAQIEEAGLEQICGDIMSVFLRWPNEVMGMAADIGGGGNYLNPYMRTHHRMECRDVNFGEEKEAAVAAINILSEANKLLIPAEFDMFHSQMRRWRRTKEGRIKKGNDHLCDTAICYFSKFIDELGVSGVRVTPRTFQTGAQRPEESHLGVVGERRLAEERAPVIRGFSGRRRH